MSEYDGSIVFNTKIDSSSLQSALEGLKKSAEQAQNPMAKLRDVMQGPIAAAKELIAVGQKITGVFNDLENEWAAQETAISILKSTLKATGAEAWTSADSVEALASKMQKLTGYADDNILAMQNVLLGFKSIKGDNFEEATIQILNMSKVMGMDLVSSAQAVGKALDDPIQGVDSLRRQGFFFTDEQKTTLKALVETGDKAKAQQIILNELATTYGGAAEAANSTASAIKNKLGVSINELKESLGQFVSESLKPTRERLIETVDSFTAFFDKVNESPEAKEKLKDLAAGLEAVTVAVVAFIAVSKGSAAIEGLTTAISGLWAVLSANPWALVLAGVAAAIVALVEASKNHADALDAEVNSYQANIDKASSLATEYENLASKQTLSKTEQDRLQELSQLLIDKYPTLTQETIALAAANGTLAEKAEAAAAAEAKKAAAQLLPQKEARYAQAVKELANYSQILGELEKLPPGGTYLGISKVETSTYQGYIKSLRNEITQLGNEIENEKKVIYGFPMPTSEKKGTPSPDTTGAGTGTKKKTQGEQLKELDTEYQARIELAKRAGEDTAAVEKEWYDKRLELLASFVVEDTKKGISVDDSLASGLAGYVDKSTGKLRVLGTEIDATQKKVREFAEGDAVQVLIGSTAGANADAVEANTQRIEAAAESAIDLDQNTLDKIAEANTSSVEANTGRIEAYIKGELAKGQALIDNTALANATSVEQNTQRIEEYIEGELAKEQTLVDNTALSNAISVEENTQRIEQAAKDAIAAQQTLIDNTALANATAVEENTQRIEASAKQQIELDDYLEQLKIGQMTSENEAMVLGLQEGVKNLESAEKEKQEIIESTASENADTIEENTRRVEAYIQGQLAKERAVIDETADSNAAYVEENTQQIEKSIGKRVKATKSIQDYTDNLQDSIKAIKLQNQGLDANFKKILATARASGVEEEEIQKLIAAYKEYQIVSGRRPFLDITADQLDQIGASISAIGGALASLSKDSSNVWASMATMLVDAIKIYETSGADIEAIASLTESLASLADSAGLESFSVLKDQMDSIGSTLLEMLSPILDFVIQNISTLAGMFQELAPAVEPLIEIMSQLMIIATELSYPLVFLAEALLPTLVSIFNIFSELFVKLYNGVVVPVGNAIIIFFNKLYNGIVSIINWAIKQINSVLKALGIAQIKTIAYKKEDEGTLKPVGVGENDTTSPKYTEELQSANDALKENKELFTDATKAADAYAAELTSVVKAASSFYDSLKDVGTDIANELVNNLVDGLSGDDFMYAIEEYIRKAVIQSVVYTASMQSQLAAIGTAIAQAIASGSTDYSSITASLAALYETASAAAAIAEQIIEAAFGSYDVGTLSVGRDQIAQIHKGEMILPSGIAEEARKRGITIDPIGYVGRAGLMAATRPITITSEGIINIDGREIGRAAWQHTDEFMGSAYGN